MTFTRQHTSSTLALGLLLLWSCEGSLMEPARPGGGGVGGGNGGPNGGPIGQADSLSKCEERWPARIALLSDFQHVSTLRSLLGSELIAGEDAPRRELKPFAQKGVVVNTSLVHTRMSWAEEAVAKLRASPSQVTGCATVDAACAESYLRRFIPRAFRRPVSNEEISDLMTVYGVAAQTSALNGLARAVEAALASPSFMYRRELGAEGAGSEVSLDDYELASVLSYALSDAPPDDALWKAAEAHTLTTELASHVDRLLGLQNVQESVTGTLLASWGLGNVFGAVKDPTLYPAFTPQLQGSMYRETELLVSDVLWKRKASVSELLSTRSSFVNSALAGIYGVPKPTGTDFAAVELPPERAGLLTQASVLAMLARTDSTSVVARGLFVRGLLCMPKMPSPPEELAGDISNLLKQDMTERERADVRAQNSTCAGCHAGIDPFGLLLESYDALGRHRTTLAGKPIDAHVTIKGMNAWSGDFADVLAFSKHLASSDELGTCVATRLLSYASQDDALTANDCRVETALEGSQPAALGMNELVQRVLTSVALRTRKKEMP